VAGLVAVSWAVSPLAGAAALAAAAVWVLAATTTCDATTLVSGYLGLLVLVPARYIFGPLGSMGTPAVLVGLVALAWWAIGRFAPALAPTATGFQPIRTVVVLFAWVTVLTYGYGFARPLEELEVRSADRALIALVSLCGVALLVTDGVPRRERLEVLLHRLVGVAVVLACFGIVQFSTGLDPAGLLKLPGLQQARELRSIQEGGAVRRVAGTALHPIEFGVVLAMALPVALHFAFHAPRARRGRQWAAALTIAVALPMSVSRSALVAVAAVFVVLVPSWSWRRRSNVAAAVVLLLGAMQVAIPGLLGTLKSLVLNAGSDPSVQGRTDDYGPVLDLWRETPWLGRGFGTFLPERYRFLDNQYLGTLIDSGVVGVVALALLLLVALGVARGAERRAADAVTRSLARSLQAASAVAMATFFTFDALSFPMNAGVLFVIFGCSGVLWRLVREGEPGPAPVSLGLSGGAGRARGRGRS